MSDEAWSTWRKQVNQYGDGQSPRQFLTALVVVIGFGWLTGCADPTPTAARWHASVTGKFDEQSATGTLGVDSAGTGEANPISIVTYPTAILATVIVSGTITGNHPNPLESENTNPAGHWGNDCPGQASVDWPGGGFAMNCHSSDTAKTADSGLFFIQGAVTANRGDVRGDTGWTFTGDQTIQINLAAATLELTPTSVSINPGQQASFTASISPSTLGGDNIPWDSLLWTYSGSPKPVCYSNNPCAWNPTTTGLLRATALVNGVHEMQSGQVYVHCPTGDSLFDSDSVRLAQLLDLAGELLDSSYLNNPPSRRREEDGYVGTSSGSYTSWYNPSGSAGACSSNGAVAIGNGISDHIWFVHTHPFIPGVDPLPASCGGGTADLPGPSDSDFYNLPALDTGVIIDEKNIYRFTTNNRSFTTVPRYNPSANCHVI